MKHLFPVLCLLFSVLWFSACQTTKLPVASSRWGAFSQAGGPSAAPLPPGKANLVREPAISGAIPPAPAPEATESVFLASAGKAVTPVNAPKPVLSLPAPAESKYAARQPVQIAQPRQLHKLAVAGAAASMLAFLPFIAGISLLFAVPLALAGVFLSRRAIRKISEDNENYRGLGLAKAGFAVGLVVLALLLLFGAAALVVG